MRARGNAAGSLLCLCARQEVAAIGVVLVCAWLGWLTTRAFELQARSGHIPLVLPLAVLAGIFSRRREDSGEAPRGQAPNELWNQICSTCHVGHPSESGFDVFGSFFEQSRDGLRLTDVEGRILAVNQAYCEMAGLRREQLVGQSFVCVYPEAEREQALARYRAEVAEGRLRRVVEREWQTPCGRRIWVEAHLSRIELRGQVYVLAAFRDVSDRRLLERELAAKVEQARAFLASTSVGIALTDPEGRIQRANPSLCRMLGIGLDEAAGQAWRDLVQVVAEAEAEAGGAACQEDPGHLRLALPATAAGRRRATAR
jgi:PAS domain S-box-containing protein